MGDIVSLSKRRKQKARVEKREKGAQNATLFGRTKLERARDKDAKDRLDRTLDGARRETDTPD
jgi:hypothetical protein